MKILLSAYHMPSTVLEANITQNSSSPYPLLLDIEQYMDIKETVNNAVNETNSFSAAQYHKLPHDILLLFIIGNEIEIISYSKLSRPCAAKPRCLWFYYLKFSSAIMH